MPVNLISLAVTWLASHLVAFSLLGFLIAGLYVFGLFGSGDTVTSVPARDAAGVAASDAAEGAAAHTAARSLSETADGSSPQGQPRRTQLIGGSLPIQGQADAPGAQTGPVVSADANGFRPPEEASVPAVTVKTREDYLQQARRAFWNGEFEAAEAGYLAMIAAYPADADGFGELGNLYQSMGKPERALDAYYEAAVRLKASGEQDRFRQLAKLLAEQGDPRADQLTR